MNKIKNSRVVSFGSFCGEVKLTGRFLFTVPTDSIGTRVDQTKEFIVGGGVNRIEFMAVPAFDLNCSFHEKSFEEQLMTRVTTIVRDAIRHKLFLKDSSGNLISKGVRVERCFSVIHKI